MNILPQTQNKVNEMTPDEAAAALGHSTTLSEQLLMPKMQDANASVAPETAPQATPAPDVTKELASLKTEFKTEIENMRTEMKDTIKQDMAILRDDIKSALSE